jgi:Rrf2 family protein
MGPTLDALEPRRYPPHRLLSTVRTNAVMQVSKRVEYALRAVIYLAGLSPELVVSFKDIAERQRAPKDFLAKILRGLVDAGILRSARGSAGGFALARHAADITFLDVIVAMEGPIALNDCCAAGDGCSHMGVCSMETVWRRAEFAMLDVFRRTTIESVVARPHLAFAQGVSASMVTR